MNFLAHDISVGVTYILSLSIRFTLGHSHFRTQKTHLARSPYRGRPDPSAPDNHNPLKPLQVRVHVEGVGTATVPGLKSALRGIEVRNSDPKFESEPWKHEGCDIPRDPNEAAQVHPEARGKIYLVQLRGFFLSDYVSQKTLRPKLLPV